MGEIEETSKYTENLCSRKTEHLMRELLNLEIPEIEEGVIEIKKIAREARTKNTDN